MTSPTSQAAKLYVVINQAPNGPHSPVDVLRLLQQGTLTRETLICEDGGAAWVPLGQMEAGLWQVVQPPPVIAPPVELPPPPVAPPLPEVMPAPFPVAAPPSSFGPPDPVAPGALPAPAGYSGPPAPRAQKADYPVLSVAAESERDVTKPFRLLTLLSALGLFFLPWLEFRCMNTKLMEQSGLQTITAKVTVPEDLMKMAQGVAGMAQERGEFPALPSTPGADQIEQQVSKDLDVAWLTGATLFFVVLGLATAAGRSGRQNAGVAALLALMCLGGQMLSGFPLKSEMDKGMKQGAQATASRDQEAAMKMTGLSGPEDMVKMAYTPWFYAELGLLGLTVFMGFTGSPRRKS